MFCTEDNASQVWKPATQEEIDRVTAIRAEKSKKVVIVRGTWQSRVRYMFFRIPIAFLRCWQSSVEKKRKKMSEF